MQSNSRTTGLGIDELSIINKYLTRLAISLKKNGLKGSEIEKILEEERERIFKDIEFLEKINKPIDVLSIVKKHALEAGIPPSEFTPAQKQLVDPSSYFDSNLYWMMSLKSKLSKNLEENAPWNFIVISDLILTAISSLLFIITQNYVFLVFGITLQGLLYYLISRNQAFLENKGFLVLSSFVFLIVNFIYFAQSLKHYSDILGYYPSGSFYSNGQIVREMISRVLLFLFSNLLSSLVLLLNGILLAIIITLIFNSFIRNQTKQISPLLYFMLYHVIVLTLFLTPTSYYSYDSDLLVFLAIFYGVFVFNDASSYFSFLEKFSLQKNNIHVNKDGGELFYSREPESLQESQPGTNHNIGSVYEQNAVRSNLPVFKGGKIFFADLLKIDPNVLTFMKITINKKKMKKALRYPLKFYFVLIIALLVNIFAVFTIYIFNYYIGLENLFATNDEASLTRLLILIALILDAMTTIYYFIKKAEKSKIKNVLVQLSIIDGKIIPVDSIKAPPLMSMAEYYNLLRELIFSETVKIEIKPNNSF